MPSEISILPFPFFLASLVGVEPGGLVIRPFVYVSATSQPLAYVPPILQLIILVGLGCWSVRTILKRGSKAKNSPAQNPLTPIFIFVSESIYTLLYWNPEVPWQGGWTWQTTNKALWFLVASPVSYVALLYLAEYIEDRTVDSGLPAFLGFSSLAFSAILFLVGLFYLLPAGVYYAPPPGVPPSQRMPFILLILYGMAILVIGIAVIWILHLGFCVYSGLRRAFGLYTELPVDVLEVEDLPVAIEQRFRDLDEDLSQKGFVLLGCRDCGRLFKKRYLYKAYWRHSHAATICTAMCESLKPDILANRLNFYMKTVLPDEFSVTTLSSMVIDFEDPSVIKGYGYKGIADPRTLYRLHQANVTKHLSTGVAPQFPSQGNEVDTIEYLSNSYLNSLMRKGIAYRKGNLFYLTPKGLLQYLRHTVWPLRLRDSEESRSRTVKDLRALGLESWREDWLERERSRRQRRRQTDPPGRENLA